MCRRGRGRKGGRVTLLCAGAALLPREGFRHAALLLGHAAGDNNPCAQRAPVPPQGWCPSHTVTLCPIPAGMAPCPLGFVPSLRWGAAYPVNSPSWVPAGWQGSQCHPKCHLLPLAQGASSRSRASGGGQRLSSKAARTPLVPSVPPLPTPSMRASIAGSPLPGPSPACGPHCSPPVLPSWGTRGHPRSGAVPASFSPRQQDNQSRLFRIAAINSTAPPPWTLYCSEGASPAPSQTALLLPLAK